MLVRLTLQTHLCAPGFLPLVLVRRYDHFQSNGVAPSLLRHTTIHLWQQYCSRAGTEAR